MVGSGVESETQGMENKEVGRRKMAGIWNWICRNPDTALAAYYACLGVVGFVVCVRQVYLLYHERGEPWRYDP